MQGGNIFRQIPLPEIPEVKTEPGMPFEGSRLLNFSLYAILQIREQFTDMYDEQRVNREQEEF